MCSCLDWVRDHMQKRAPQLRFSDFNFQNSPALLITAGAEHPRVLLCGHLDVVEANFAYAFRATIDERHRMRGRGAADMKGPISALIDIMETESQPGLGLLLTTDEEVGGFKGVKHFVDRIDWQPEVVILPDGGANLCLVVEQKGFFILHAWLEVPYGHLNHSITDNPINTLYRAISNIKNHYTPSTHEKDWDISLTLTQLHGKYEANGLPMRADATL